MREARREARRVRRAKLGHGRVAASAALPALLAGLLAGLLVSGCAGGPVAPAAASANAAGSAPEATPAAGKSVADPSTASRATLAADALVPGLSRDAALAALSAIDGRKPSCDAAKVSAPGTGRAFLHERCRLDWAAPSPVAYVDPDEIDPDRGAGAVLRLAHVDLIDGVAVRVDLLTETIGSTREIVLVDPRLQAVMPALAGAAPPTPADS